MKYFYAIVFGLAVVILLSLSLNCSEQSALPEVTQEEFRTCRATHEGSDCGHGDQSVRSEQEPEATVDYSELEQVNEVDAVDVPNLSEE
jgi:hypothetical protein